MRGLRGLISWVLIVAILGVPFGCETVQEPPNSRAEVLALERARAEEIREDKKLKRDHLDQDLRVASMALDMGEQESHELARQTLMEVVSYMAEGVDSKEKAVAARGSIGVFGEGEKKKFFFGDPYEQALANVYLGILDMQAGDYINAGNMFRNASFVDQGTQEEGYKADFYLAMLLEGVARRIQGHQSAAEEAFRVAQRAYAFRQRMPVIQGAFYRALALEMPEEPEKKDYERFDAMFPLVFGQLPASLTFTIDNQFGGEVLPELEYAVNSAFEAAAKELDRYAEAKEAYSFFSKPESDPEAAETDDDEPSKPKKRWPQAHDFLKCYDSERMRTIEVDEEKKILTVAQDLAAFQERVLFVLRERMGDSVEQARLAESHFATVVERCNSPATNTFIIHQAGRGPVKVRQGQYGQVIQFRSTPCHVSRLLTALRPVNAPPDTLPTVCMSILGESIDYQATTRGGRKVDSILKGKAQFRDTMRVSSSLAGVLASGAIAAALVMAVTSGIVTTTVATTTTTVTASGAVATTTTTTTSTGFSSSAALSAAGPWLIAGVALLVIMYGTRKVADYVHPEGDIRGWHEVPSKLFFTCAALEPGEYELRSDSFDILGRPLEQPWTQARFQVAPDRPTIMLLGSPWQ